MVLNLYSESTHSLKEKRRIISSLKEKLRSKFNISLIESDYQDLWQKIQISIVMASNSKVLAEKAFYQIEDFIFQNYPVQKIEISREYI